MGSAGSSWRVQKDRVWSVSNRSDHATALLGSKGNMYTRSLFRPGLSTHFLLALLLCLASFPKGSHFLNHLIHFSLLFLVQIACLDEAG